MVEHMKAVCLVLHDVAPSTWADYQPFVEAVDALGDVPMTWLVVPDFHRHDALDANPAFRRVGVKGSLAMEVRHHPPRHRHITQGIDGLDEGLVIRPRRGRHIMQYQANSFHFFNHWPPVAAYGRAPRDSG